MSAIRCAIAGMSGYTGVEMTRLLLAHPSFHPVLLIGKGAAGKDAGSLYPHLESVGLPNVVAAEDADYTDIQAVFACLPHGASQGFIASLPKDIKIIDLSADFRLRDTALYETIYKLPHAAPELQPEAVYGLTEFSRDALKKTRLAACPGCYPTSALLPLLPLLQAALIIKNTIIIDAKSGISGAGRGVKQANLFAEIDGAFFPYAVDNHRHAPEMEQEMNAVCGQGAQVQFTPHIVPMTRGMVSTIYVDVPQDINALDIHNALHRRYADEAFVTVLPFKQLPNAKHVARTNNAHIGVSSTRLPGKILIVSAIDNLIKGSSGQALQNANIMFGIEETAGLPRLPFYP